MMLGPDSYYHENIEGKTKEEILKEIKLLKQEIADLRKDIKKRPFIVEFKPSRSTILECEREYLKVAIQAYKEAGGTDADLKKLK